MKVPIVLASGLIAFAVPIVAQTGQAGGGGNPAQQQGPPPKTIALVTGQVVDGTTSQPVSEAIVTLSTGAGGGRAGGMPTAMAPEVQQAMQAALAAAGGRGGSGDRRVMTSSDGRFVFHSLPPGQFTLTVTASGYASSLGVTLTPNIPGIIGGVSPATSSTTFQLKEGEFATNFRLRLWKHAVVGGVVLDDSGEPAVGLSVQVARRVMAAGRARFVPANSTKTDDRGMFRIPGLTPGDYVVVVPQAPLSMPASIMSGLMDGMTSGLGIAGVAMAMIDVMSSGINPQDAMAGGVRIGDYMVASSGAVPLLSPDGRLLAYQTQFHPGVPAPSQATVLQLKSGEEKTDITFQLRLIPTSRISGVATGPEGPVANLGVKLVVPGDGTVSDSEFDVATAITKADGTFSFFGVPPGQFLLKAEKQPRPSLPAEALASNPMAASIFGPGGAPGVKEMLFIATPVNVASDIDNLVLQLRPGYSVSGRVEFASVTGRQAPARLNAASINLMPMDGRMPNILGLMSNQDLVTAQGEFKTKHQTPGRYFLTVTGYPGWQVKSATIGGRDVLDAALEIRDADVSGIVITFTDKVAAVTGTVRSVDETDLSETSVLVFPLDFRTWAANGMNPRRGLTGRVARNGNFTVPNVPAGDYFIVAVDRATQGELQDPAYVELLSRVATRISVAADNVTQELNKVRVVR